MNPSDPQNRILNDQCVEALRRGDKVVFARVVRAWESSMLQTAARILGSVTEAEEVRQIVLMRMVESPTKIPTADRFAPWIRRCVINESLRRVRRQKVERDYQRNATLSVTGKAESKDPATIAIQRDQITRLHQVMAILTPHQRALVSLRYDDGLTIREIAKVVQSAKTTVHKQLTEAIQLLRIHMKDGCIQREKANE